MEIRSGTITSDPSKRNCTKHKHGHNELFPSTIKIQKTLSDVDMSIFNINSQRYLQIIYDANTLIIPPYVSEFENLGVKLYPGPRALRHAGIASPVNSRYVLWWHCLQSCTRKCLVQSSRSLTETMQEFGAANAHNNLKNQYAYPSMDVQMTSKLLYLQF